MSANTPFDSKDYGRLLTDLLDTVRKGAVAVDDHEGSVARTLLEAFARELAVCYEQLGKVYQFGYIDSAEGVALDKVVALLGIERRKAGHVEGTVTFSRGQPAPEDIPIPAGTLLAGRDIPVFETLNKEAAIPKGGQEVTVKVRAVEPGGITVDSGQISLMPRPIWGIDTVSNTLPLELSQRQETDSELRERARYRLERINHGTISSIELSVRSLGIKQVTIQESPDLPAYVTVVLGDPDISDELTHQAETLLEQIRPAGVRVDVKVAERIYVQIAATLILRENYPSDRLQRIRSGLETGLTDYIQSLKIGELVRASKIEAILTGAPEVAESKTLAGKKKLNAYVLQQDQLADATNNYVLLNGDLRLGTEQRAYLDAAKLPILLKLEPPALEVWVDVTFDQALSPEQELAARKSLQVILDTYKPGQSVDYKQLNPAGPPLVADRTVNSFTLIHQQDNLAVTLTAENKQSDKLREREQLRVARLTAEEKEGG